MEGAKDNTTMKKTYIKPDTTVVALNVRDNVLQNTSIFDTTNPESMDDDDSFGAREVIDAPDAWEEW